MKFNSLVALSRTFLNEPFKETVRSCTEHNACHLHSVCVPGTGGPGGCRCPSAAQLCPLQCAHSGTTSSLTFQLFYLLKRC